MKQDWQLTTANVYSVEWIEPSRNDWGHYEVTYSYRAGDEYYTGHVSDYSFASTTFLKRNDSIEIRYNPQNPRKSYYPDAQRPIISKLSLALIGGLSLGALVMLSMYLAS
jgi:hypothetical protein